MPEERRIEDIERLARMEEQVKGMREDFSDFKEYMTGTVATFMQTISSMHRDYMPRSELTKELALRDVANQEMEKRLDKIEKSHEKLSTRPTWQSIAIITVCGAIVGSLVLGLIELLMKK